MPNRFTNIPNEFIDYWMPKLPDGPLQVATYFMRHTMSSPACASVAADMRRIATATGVDLGMVEEAIALLVGIGFLKPVVGRFSYQVDVRIPREANVSPDEALNRFTLRAFFPAAYRIMS